jgi:hypothetical protein
MDVIGQDDHGDDLKWSIRFRLAHRFAQAVHFINEQRTPTIC